MCISQVNYDDLANGYDQCRALSPNDEMLWRCLFEQQLGLVKTSRVLDVGCGTGRFSVLIARQFQCSVVGIDPSLSMLAQARSKCSNGEPKCLGARSEALPFSQGAFDVCLASQVIHHFRDKPRAFLELYRVLSDGGRLGIRTAAHEHLTKILDYRFFPSALQIDCERLPNIPDVRDMLLAVGFSTVKQIVIRQQLFESADDYLAKVRNKYSSVLSLISQQEYQNGLEEAAAYLRNNELETNDLYTKVTFLVGIK
jgi:ubiquinone/menaquinone biosynthesis C-methylase UbiE